MSTEEKIQNVLRETYDVSEEFTTTIGTIIKLATDKYPDSRESDVKTALAHMKGWERIGESLQDQAKISPSFFQ